VVAHVFAVVPFPTEEAGRGACALSAWVGLWVMTVVGVVRGVVGSATVVADHSGGRSRTVSNDVAEPMASVTLGQGGAVVKFAGLTIGPEESGGGTADQLETSAIWVVKGPDDTAAVAAVSDVSGGATKPSRWGQGLPSSAHRVFPQLGLKDRGRREIAIVIPEARDAEEHNGGVASAGDSSAVGSQVGEENRIILGDLVDLHLTFENKDEVVAAGVW
jgi:hypothetical protein